MKSMRLYGGAFLAGLLSCTGPWFAGTATAQESALGAEEFTRNCATCHGTDAKGGGEFARFLTVEPPSLTILSKNNGGRFPLLKVFQTIDGRQIVGAHGTRDMPIWGTAYRADVGHTFGPYGGERAVRARILELVFYLESIQE